MLGKEQETSYERPKRFHLTRFFPMVQACRLASTREHRDQILLC